MSGKLTAVINSAIKTFSTLKDTSVNLVETPSFANLIELVNKLQFIDFHREPALITSCEFAIKSSNTLEYLPLYEDRKLTIGVFILKSGGSIPLHDHPGMFGLLRVLSGELLITSYNLSGAATPPPTPSAHFYYDSPLDVTKNESVSVTPLKGCCIVTPTASNIHQVQCVQGPAAFLDILAPPYASSLSSNAARSCHYFEEVVGVDGKSVQLRQIPNPPGF